MSDHHTDLLGAHVSTSGGAPLAPARGAAIGASAIQVFTKSPNQWRDPEISAEVGAQFRNALSEYAIRTVVGHDSYLINLASPDRTLRARSIRACKHELERCRTLGITLLVSHPGNYITRRTPGLARNARACSACLRAVPGPVMLLLETTAGTGTALGATFEELAELRALVDDDVRDRVGFCADTCHLYSAGYDLVERYEEVWSAWDRTIGLRHLRCLHLNDSSTPLGSRRDRHEVIGRGTLGPEPFRRIMQDPRFAGIPKILETPKGDDGVTNDRRTLRRLRAWARS